MKTAPSVNITQVRFSPPPDSSLRTHPNLQIPPQEPMMMPDPVFPRLLFSGIPWGQMERERERAKERRLKWKTEVWKALTGMSHLCRGVIHWNKANKGGATDEVPSVNMQNSSHTCERETNCLHYRKYHMTPKISTAAHHSNKQTRRLSCPISLWDQIIRLIQLICKLPQLTSSKWNVSKSFSYKKSYNLNFIMF